MAIFSVAGAALVWNSFRRAEPPVEVPPSAVVVPSPEPELPAAAPSAVPSSVPVQTATPPAVITTTAVVRPTPLPTPSAPVQAPAEPMTPQERIDGILLSDELSEREKSRQLLELLPTLPETLQEEAAQHMCNLMPDENYSQLGPLLTNGLVSEPIMDVVMGDLLSRPNRLKLPLLLHMARNEAHPRQEESRSVLEIYLEHDFGSDWPAWERSLQAYIKQNPE